MITVIQIRKQTQSRTIKANQRRAKVLHNKRGNGRNGNNQKNVEEEGAQWAGCMRRGIRETTINTQIKGVGLVKRIHTEGVPGGTPGKSNQ
jgi:hypothetical protein